MQSNPIQQRIEIIAEKWEEAKTQPEARIVCLRCLPDELEMADTFYTYLIAADTPVYDIGFHFDSRCLDAHNFSEALLAELAEVLEIWNQSTKDERIDYVPVNWQPEKPEQPDRNAATLFVENFNRLADGLALPDGFFAVAVFKNASLDKYFPAWLRQAAEAGIGNKVKFLVHELITEPRHQALERKYPELFAAVPLALNMPQAMEQIAAMGDPSDPATPYRQRFMQMINAMGAGKEEEAEKRGEDCLALATENIAKDPYWVMQVVVVNIALGNDKIRYKKKKETLRYADRAVEAATGATAFLDPKSAGALLSQALMFRGTAHYTQAHWKEGYEDFKTAFDLCVQQGGLPLAIEAGRMGGHCAVKSGQKKAGIELWAAGARLGQSLDAETARASTYGHLLKSLLAADYREQITTEELHGLAQKVYGEEWVNSVRGSAKLPDETALVAEGETTG